MERSYSTSNMLCNYSITGECIIKVRENKIHLRQIQWCTVLKCLQTPRLKCFKISCSQLHTFLLPLLCFLLSVSTNKITNKTISNNKRLNSDFIYCIRFSVVQMRFKGERRCLWGPLVAGFSMVLKAAHLPIPIGAWKTNQNFQYILAIFIL